MFVTRLGIVLGGKPAPACPAMRIHTPGSVHLRRRSRRTGSLLVWISIAVIVGLVPAPRGSAEGESVESVAEREIAALRGADRARRSEARRRLVAAGPAVIPWVEKALEDWNGDVRRGAVSILAALGTVGLHALKPWWETAQNRERVDAWRLIGAATPAASTEDLLDLHGESAALEETYAFTRALWRPRPTHATAHDRLVRMCARLPQIEAGRLAVAILAQRPEDPRADEMLARHFLGEDSWERGDLLIQLWISGARVGRQTLGSLVSLLDGERIHEHIWVPGRGRCSTQSRSGIVAAAIVGRCLMDSQGLRQIYSLEDTSKVERTVRSLLDWVARPDDPRGPPHNARDVSTDPGGGPADVLALHAYLIARSATRGRAGTLEPYETFLSHYASIAVSIRGNPSDGVRCAALYFDRPTSPMLEAWARTVFLDPSVDDRRQRRVEEVLARLSIWDPALTEGLRDVASASGLASRWKTLNVRASSAQDAARREQFRMEEGE